LIRKEERTRSRRRTERLEQKKPKRDKRGWEIFYALFRGGAAWGGEGL